MNDRKDDEQFTTEIASWTCLVLPEAKFLSPGLSLQRALEHPQLVQLLPMKSREWVGDGYDKELQEYSRKKMRIYLPGSLTAFLSAIPALFQGLPVLGTPVKVPLINRSCVKRAKMPL